MKPDINSSDENTWEVCKNRKSHNCDLDDEWRFILVEAYRGMRNCYGETLFFTTPKRCTSLVYRSEREFLESYDERFAWCVHFYQSALSQGQYEPDRYAGMLFLRPREIHCRESDDQSAAKEHKKVAPAICEGFLCPPKSLTLSPYMIRCLDNYSSPYCVLPFPSIPFAAARFGAACGHSTLAAAILMGHLGVTYSPYELAVAAINVNIPLRKKLTQDDFHRILGLKIEIVPRITEEYCHSRAVVESFFIDDDKGSICENDERAFSDILSTYLYLGIPVLYPVNSAILYDSLDDVSLGKTQIEVTPETERHMILIHSLVRQSSSGDGNSFPLFVFADSTDLHTTGGMFHVASCRRLLSARLKSDPDLPDEETNGVPIGQKDAVNYAVCLPKGLDRGYESACDYFESWDRQTLPIDLDVKLAPKHPHVTLRERSQTLGFLVHHVFPEQYTHAVRDREWLQRLLAIYHELDLPAYFWIAQDTSGNDGLILDARDEGNDRKVRGCYSVSAGKVVIQAKDKEKNWGQLTLERGHDPVLKHRASPLWRPL